MGYIGAGPTRFNTADDLTVTGDAEFNGNLTVKGTTTTIDSASVQTIDLGDNDKIRLGDSDDLQIYHDGSNSFVNDLGTGNLVLRGANVSIQDASANNQVFVNNGGAVDIRYAGSAKLATTATGVDVKNVASGGNAKLNITTESTGGGTSEILFSDNATGRGRIYYNHGSNPEKLHIETAGTDAIVIDNSQNVGIGTSAPDVTTHIVGSAGKTTLASHDAQTIAVVENNADAQFAIVANSANASQLFFGDESSELVGRIRYDHSTNIMRLYTNSAERLRIGSSGNVSIGTSSTGSEKLRLKQSTNSSVGGLAIESSDAYGVFMGREAGSTGAFTIRNNGSDTLSIKSGNVGIGTSSPGELLHLSLPSGTNGDIVRLSRSAGAYSFQLGVSSGATSNLYISNNSNNNIIDFTSSGNVGIGDGVFGKGNGYAGNTGATASGTLDLYNYTSGHYQLNAVGAFPMTFATNNTERMRIDSSGRVTMPYQPSFAASRSQGDVTNAVYVYPNVYHNTGGHYNNSNGRFTAPVTGSYFISANHMSANTGTFNNERYLIRVNGSTFQIVYSSNGTSVHHRWNWHGVIYLNAGDYVDVFIPTGMVIYGQSNLYHHFSGYLIG